MKVRIKRSLQHPATNHQKIRKLAAELASRALATSTLPWGTIAVELTDGIRIREVKQAVFAIDEVTDVIAVTYDPMPGIDRYTNGEIFVNVERAFASYPKRAGWSANHELALYIAHGFDHLSGEDDTTEAQRRRMRRRELRWLRDAERAKLLAGLFEEIG